MNDRSRRGIDPRAAAERAFRSATTPAPAAADVSAAPAVAAPLPAAKELVSVRLDREVLERFQADGAGWQERINQALRKSLGL